MQHVLCWLWANTWHMYYYFMKSNFGLSRWLTIHDLKETTKKTQNLNTAHNTTTSTIMNSYYRRWNRIIFHSVDDQKWAAKNIKCVLSALYIKLNKNMRHWPSHLKIKIRKTHLSKSGQSIHICRVKIIFYTTCDKAEQQSAISKVMQSHNRNKRKVKAQTQSTFLYRRSGKK